MLLLGVLKSTELVLPVLVGKQCYLSYMLLPTVQQPRAVVEEEVDASRDAGAVFSFFCPDGLTGRGCWGGDRQVLLFSEREVVWIVLVWIHACMLGLCQAVNHRSHRQENRSTKFGTSKVFTQV